MNIAGATPLQPLLDGPASSPTSAATQTQVDAGLAVTAFVSPATLAAATSVVHPPDLAAVQSALAEKVGFTLNPVTLRARTDYDLGTAYRMVAPGFEGDWIWDPAAEDEDDTGTVIAPAESGMPSGRFRRVWNHKDVRASWFDNGLHFNHAPGVNDLPLLQAAYAALPQTNNYVLANGTPYRSGTILMPDKWAISDAFVVSSSTKLVAANSGNGVTGSYGIVLPNSPAFQGAAEKFALQLRPYAEPADTPGGESFGNTSFGGGVERIALVCNGTTNPAVSGLYIRGAQLVTANGLYISGAAKRTMYFTGQTMDNVWLEAYGASGVVLTCEDLQGSFIGSVSAEHSNASVQVQLHGCTAATFAALQGESFGGAFLNLVNCRNLVFSNVVAHNYGSLATSVVDIQAGSTGNSFQMVEGTAVEQIRDFNAYPVSRTAPYMQSRLSLTGGLEVSGGVNADYIRGMPSSPSVEGSQFVQFVDNGSAIYYDTAFFGAYGSNTSYIAAVGDCLEYDVFYGATSTRPAPHVVIDLEYDSSAIQFGPLGSFPDAWGHAIYAPLPKGTWIHRKLRMKDYVAGKALSRAFLFANGTGTAGQTTDCFFRSPRITNGGATKLDLWGPSGIEATALTPHIQGGTAVTKCIPHYLPSPRANQITLTALASPPATPVAGATVYATTDSVKVKYPDGSIATLGNSAGSARPFLTAVETNADKWALPGLTGGEVVQITQEGRRLEQFIGGNPTLDAHWLVLRNTCELVVQNNSVIDLEINDVPCSQGSLVNVGFCNPEAIQLLIFGQYTGCTLNAVKYQMATKNDYSTAQFTYTPPNDGFVMQQPSPVGTPVTFGLPCPIPPREPVVYIDLYGQG